MKRMNAVKWIGLILLLLVLLPLPLAHGAAGKVHRLRSVYLSEVLLTFLLGCSLFLAGPMTILREWRSSYMLFSTADIQVADFIRDNTEAHGVFLTDYNWHLNPVSVLTGRSIVCGPDLYLYYHGIDTGERKADIEAMFADPEQSEALFQSYGVRYVYVGHTERANFDVDIDYFRQHARLIYDSDGIQVYDLEADPA